MESNVITLSSTALKQSYQKNMTIGFGISAGLHLMAVLIVYAIITGNYQEPILIQPKTIDKPTGIIMPPSLSQQKEQIKLKIQEHKIKPSVGILVPVPEEEAPEETNVATQEELANMAPETPAIDPGAGISIDVNKVLNEILPKQDTIIRFDIPPAKVRDVMPIYPSLAARAGVEGDVWIKVLIDKEGSVRDAVVYKPSSVNAGFEESAIDAAKQTIWSPAIANGHPIAVWVTYRIVFKLK